jgi:hypothetical protein
VKVGLKGYFRFFVFELSLRIFGAFQDEIDRRPNAIRPPERSRRSPFRSDWVIPVSFIYASSERQVTLTDSVRGSPS